MKSILFTDGVTLTEWRENKAYILKLLLNYSFKKYVL